MEIKPDDLTRPDVRALLEEHVAEMHRISPPGSVHALDLPALKAPSITFWTVWSGEELMGCGALREIDPAHAEIKSMRTARAHRRQGVAQAMLNHLLAVAESRGYERVSLETGSQGEFAPARRLYEEAGFQYGPPFDHYRPDPNSVFMTKVLLR